MKSSLIKSALAVRKKSKVVDSSLSELDVNFYRETNADLLDLSDATLIKHWKSHGKNEGRAPNLESFARQNNLKSASCFDIDLDLDFYLSCYPDVRKSGLSTLLQAKLHWLKFGKKEGRCCTFNEWLNKYHLEPITEVSDEELSHLVARNPLFSFEQIVSTLCGHVTHVIKFKDNKKENGEVYYDLALNFLAKSKDSTDSYFWYQAALKSAATAYHENEDEKVLELKAELYLEYEDLESAAAIYEYLCPRANKRSQLFEANYADCLFKLKRTKEAVDVLLKGIKEKPSLSFLSERLNELLQAYFLQHQGAIQLYAALDNRAALCDLHYQISHYIYSSYYASYAHSAETPLKANLSTNEVLMVADFHVPQCVRYRIDQKVEQLEEQGKAVHTMDWMALSEHQNELALYDVVIFYRVPAVPEVLKAMAQVNANGRASFYEIDDLLFEESYPAPMETFGGYIGLETHIELRKSMASFRAAAQFCRYGIGSTQPLCEKLNQLVFSKQSILHRNGLDYLNRIQALDKSEKNTVDIFYGSGTQAHNSDFIEQALPALKRILTKYKNTRLVIAGYLNLPSDFVSGLKKQVVQLPPVNKVQAYWSFLEQADINLAVLNDDDINGCKSELKWFEAACFSIPSVLSTTANYRDIINHGKDAYLVATEDEWFEVLNTLIVNPEKRQEIATAALQHVQEKYSVEALGKSLVSKMETFLPRKTAKKKIALVNVFFPPQAIGGATRVLADNFDVLQKQYGDDFELVVFTSDDHCTTPYSLTTYQHQGVTVYRSTILYRENMDWHPKDPEMYDLFERFLEAEKPDLVHFHCVQRLTASIVEATKDLGIPYLVTAHDAWWISDHQFLIDGDDNVYPDGHPDPYAPRTLPNNVTLGDSIERINYFKELLAGAKKILTVSDGFAEIYRKNGYPDIIVNKNGISASVEWQPKETSHIEKVICGHIGGMANHKGYFLLKETIENQQPKNIEMLIVDHSKPEGYENKTTWGKVPVTFIGRVAQNKVADLYKILDVLFAPSTWPESYGLVTREAAACGCWVVASNLGGIGEDVLEGKTGFKVAPELEALGRAIIEIDRQPEKYKQKIEQVAIRLVDQQVDELVGIYNG